MPSYSLPKHQGTKGAAKHKKLLLFTQWNRNQQKKALDCSCSTAHLYMYLPSKILSLLFFITDNLSCQSLGKKLVFDISLSLPLLRDIFLGIIRECIVCFSLKKAFICLIWGKSSHRDIVNMNTNQQYYDYALIVSPHVPFHII